MPNITLASILKRTKTYLQSSSFISDDEILNEIRLFMDIELPINDDLYIFRGRWRFATEPGRYVYQMPLDRYTGVGNKISVDGVEQELSFDENRLSQLYTNYRYYTEQTVGAGNGGSSYNLSLSPPVLRGYATSNGHIVPEMFIGVESENGYLQCTDDGQGGIIGDVASTGTIDYITGTVNVTFNQNIPEGNNIEAKFHRYDEGRPCCAVFKEGNLLELYAVPDRQYVIELPAYVKPSALIETLDELQYNWLYDYIALGSARRIFTMLINDEMLQRTENRFNHYRYVVNNRSAKQAAKQKVRSIYDDSIINYR